MQETNGAILTGLDESFTHQLVAPHLFTAHHAPAWGERCYHLIHVDEGLTLNAGRQLYVHDARRYAFTGVVTPEAAHCLRVAEHFAPGDDPDLSTLGGISIEVVRPLEAVRIVLDEPGLPVSCDLTFTARFPAIATRPNRIELNGEVVTEYMNFFQSGLYSGTVVVDGTEFTVHDRAGFRDRGWGLRKHEGSARRGLMIGCFCELPTEALYLLVYETASGRRAFTEGWLIDETGVADRVAGAEHNLRLDSTLVEGGVLDVTFASGRTSRVEFDVENRIYLSAVGYSPDPEMKAPGQYRFDLTDPATVARLDGQNDNGCSFLVDGVHGHGYVETGVGIHPRYRPEETEQ